jgi:GNAT superfamily N-acetyltransferase
MVGSGVVSPRAEIRRIETADLEAVARFRAAQEGGGYLAALRGPEYYAWKYTGAAASVAIGAFSDGELIGLLCGMPRRVRVGEYTLEVAELGEIFVDESARGSGLFRLLHEELVSILQRRDIDAILCRPAPAADKILRAAFRYEQTLSIAATTHNVPLDPPRPSPGVDPVIEDATLPFGPDFDRLDADLSSGSTATVRDGAYLRRRYALNPTPYTVVSLRAGHRLEGWLVLLGVDREGQPPDGYLVDALLWPDAKVRRSAVAAAMRWFNDRGCHRAFAWRADHPHDAAIFADPNPLSRLKPTRLAYVVLPLKPAGRQLLRTSMKSRWVFRMGDTDGI